MILCAHDGGCDRKRRKGAYCAMHYARWKKYGDTNRGRLTAEDRFWRNVDKMGPTAALVPEFGPCWVWTGRTNRDGYGRLTLGETEIGAHRFAYELLVGPVPAGLVLDHFACERRRCVRPTHVKPVTNEENVARGANGRRPACPQNHPYTPENTWRDRRGWRHCRTCRRSRDAAEAGSEAKRARSREAMRRTRARRRSHASATREGQIIR